jgi:hypothetical protein
MYLFLKINLLILATQLFTNIFAQKASTALPSTLSKGPSERFIGNVWVQYFVKTQLMTF